MKTTSLIALASLVGVSAAFVVPQARDGSSNSSTIDDTVLLNFGLTLQYLESAFFSGGVSSYTKDDFTNAGLPPWSRGRFVQIAAHEQAHVQLLSSVLGSSATQACNYSFPYSDPSSFAALAQTISDASVSAYVGIAQYITDTTYLTNAAAILATEARQAAWIAGPVNKLNAWSGAYDTPLSLNTAYTLAAQFISGCPSSNPSLPVQAYPSLTIANATLGQSCTVTAANNVTTEGQYVAFLSGLTPTFVQVQGGQVAIPSSLMGTAYAVLTSSNSVADDSTITAGVAVLQFPFNSTDSLDSNSAMQAVYF